MKMRDSISRLKAPLRSSTVAPGPSTSRIGLAAVAGLLVLVFSLHSGAFFTSGNALSIGVNSASVAIAAMGSAILVITGNVDLSIGSMYGLIGMIVGEVAVHVGSPAVAVAAGLVAGVAFGTINGLLVRWLKISPLIVTIALLAVYSGIGYVVNSNVVYGFRPSFINLGRGELASIQYSVIVAVVVVCFVSFLLTRSVLGLRLYAIGGDVRAAERAGVRVGRITLWAYAFNGLLIGVIAILTTAQLGSADPTLGVNFEFSVLTAVILGGVAFSGGAGRPLGVIIGVLTIGILNAGLIFEGLQVWWQQIAQGGILLLALAADQVGATRRIRRATRLGRKRGANNHLPIATFATSGSDREDSRGVLDNVGAPSAVSGQTVIEARGVEKWFGAVCALEPTSLALHAGEVTALLGDNGAGKSTLVKLISGVARPDGGELRLDGSAVSFRDPADARAAGVETVYQDLALCPNLSVTHNLMLGREQRRRWLRLIPVRDDRAAATNAERRLAALGINLADTNALVEGLSGGQRQAIAVARVMGEHVRMVCLDEPTAALGVAQTAHVLGAIRALASDGTAVMMVTHDVNAVTSVSDRVVVLRHGQIIHDGPTAALTELALLQLMAGREIGAAAPDPEPELAHAKASGHDDG
jgi:ribose/xylose/arabinose/galactoside ABC-type transport system permease subunit/ABC-type branched-subunit amino acid transport system ATPase component